MSDLGASVGPGLKGAKSLTRDGIGFEGPISTYERLQLDFGEDDRFSLRSLGCLSLVHPNESTSLDFVANYQNNVVIHFDDSTTLVWDVFHCQISGWKLQGVTNVLEVRPPFRPF